MAFGDRKTAGKRRLKTVKQRCRVAAGGFDAETDLMVESERFVQLQAVTRLAESPPKYSYSL